MTQPGRTPGPPDATALSFPRRLAVSAVLVAVLAVSLSAEGPAGAQGGGYEPDPEVVADVGGYARETQSGFDHVLRWMRVLKSFGALEPMTAAEAQGYADIHLPARWDPVVDELGKLEAQAGYEPDQQVVADVRGYARETTNGFDHVLRWMRVLDSLGALEAMSAAEARGYADGGWQRWVPVAAELAELEAAASANQAPVVDTEARGYREFTRTNNAPRSILVSKGFDGVFSDPDGDNLSYTVSITGGRPELVDIFQIHAHGQSDAQAARSGYRARITHRLWFRADDELDWKALTPALPDRPVVTATVTATDPGGLSASISGDFLLWWASYPEVVDATRTEQAIELRFDLAVEDHPAPAPGQFTVHAVEAGGSTRTVAVSRVSADGRVLTLELAEALSEEQTVTLDYLYDYFDDTPLQRAGGGYAAPGFTGLPVELSPSAPDGPEGFNVSVGPDSLSLMATWAAVEEATTYNLRWRQVGEEFDEDDAAAISGLLGAFTVSGYGRWEVRLQACNDHGCGAEASRTVDVAPALPFSLQRTEGSDGQVRPRTFTATWDPVDGATSYSLSWRRVGSAPQAAAQPGADRNARRGSGGRRANDEAVNRIEIPGDRTSAAYPVPDDGEYEAELRADGGGDERLAQGVTAFNQVRGRSDTTPPRLEWGQVDGDRMTLYFSEPLNEAVGGGRWHPYIQFDNCNCVSGGVRRAAMEISGNTVTVDFDGWVRAVEGLNAYVAYWVRPGDTSLRDLNGNLVWTPNVGYDGSRSTETIWLQNLTGPPKVLPVPVAGSFRPAGVAITSDPGDDRFYVAGDTVEVTLTFSEAVDVTGTPRLRIDLDPADGGERWADYAGGSGTKMLEFHYTVVDGDFSADGVAVVPNTLQLNGGTIRSASALTVENARLAHEGLNHDPLDKVVTPPSEPPVLVSASVTNSTLTLTFSETLGAAASLANSAFTVKKTPQDGTEQTVALSGSPAVNASAVTLTLASAALITDTAFKVSYTKPATGTNNRIIDADGEEAESFTDVPAENVADTTPPVLVRGEIDGDVVTLYFSEALDETTGGRGDFYRINLPWNTDFMGAPRHGRCQWGAQWINFTTTPREVYVSGNTVVVVGLKDDPQYRVGVGHPVVNYLYVANTTTPADQRLRDLSGNAVSTPEPYNRGKGIWATRSIYLENVTRLPFPKAATVEGRRLILTFNAPMDGGSKPAGSVFTVKVNNSAVSLAGFDISGHEVTLTLSQAVATGANVTVSYSKPANRPLQNVICEDAPAFTDEPVTNLTQ